jgi:hypothetical protein
MRLQIAICTRLASSDSHMKRTAYSEGLGRAAACTERAEHPNPRARAAAPGARAPTPAGRPPDGPYSALVASCCAARGPLRPVERAWRALCSLHCVVVPGGVARLGGAVIDVGKVCEADDCPYEVPVVLYKPCSAAWQFCAWRTATGVWRFSFTCKTFELLTYCGLPRQAIAADHPPHQIVTLSQWSQPSCLLQLGLSRQAPGQAPRRPQCAGSSKAHRRARAAAARQPSSTRLQGAAASLA